MPTTITPFEARRNKNTALCGKLLTRPRCRVTVVHMQPQLAKINPRIPVKLRDALHQHCKRTGMKQEAVVAEALRQHLEQKKEAK